MMTKTKTVWLLEAMYYDSAWENLGALEENRDIEVLASDGSLEQCYSLVAGDFNTLSKCGFKMRVPAAGVYVDAGGAEVFVNDNQELVNSADEVVKSLELDEEDVGAYKQGFIDAETLLHLLHRIF